VLSLPDVVQSVSCLHQEGGSMSDNLLYLSIYILTFLGLVMLVIALRWL
jgi:hypothetical protein